MSWFPTLVAPCSGFLLKEGKEVGGIWTSSIVLSTCPCGGGVASVVGRVSSPAVSCVKSKGWCC